MTLEQQLQSALLTLDRVGTRLEEARSNVNAQRQVVGVARAQLNVDEEDAILADRKPNPALQKALIGAEAELEKAERQFDLTTRACVRASDAVEAVKTEIAGNRHAAMLAALAEPMREFNALLNRGAVLSQQITNILRTGGGVDMSCVFPSPDPKDPIAGFTERAKRNALLGNLARLTVSGGVN